MNGRDSFKRCKNCGKMIGIIRERPYRKILVDAEAVMVAPHTSGREYVRIDGSKIKGMEVAYDSAVNAEPAYRPHRCGR